MVQLYFVQAFGSGSDQNATFSVNADGSYSVTGQTKDATATVDATFSGTIQNNVDGTIQGTITYARSAGTAGGGCPGASKDFPFVGARVAPYIGS
jgi:hypothetical protein